MKIEKALILQNLPLQSVQSGAFAKFIPSKIIRCLPKGNNAKQYEKEKDHKINDP